MTAPVLLRFTTDDFMQELLGVLATDPKRLGEYRVVKETWRGVAPAAPETTPRKQFALPFQRLGAARQRLKGLAPPIQSSKPTVLTGADVVPNKLFQPAHQRYYLVSSCLVCRIPGFPDRKVDPGKQEQVGFVIRRLLPKGGTTDGTFDEPNWSQNWQEHSWVSGATGTRWQLADPPAQFVDGEEVLPMFGLNYLQDDQRTRRLFAGLVPAGKREAYLAAPLSAPGAAAGTEVTARKILLRTKVIEPWKQLLDRAAKTAKAVRDKDSGAVNADALKRGRIELQESAYFVLVDLAEFLKTYLPPVWDALVQGPGASDPTDPQQRAALQALRDVRLDPLAPPPAGGPLGQAWIASITQGRQSLLATLPEVLRQLADGRVAKALDSVKASYDPSSAAGIAGYPSFVFPLADPEDSQSDLTRIHAAFPRTLSIQPPLTVDESSELSSTSAAAAPAAPTASQALDQLAVLLTRALATIPAAAAPQPSIPLAAKTPADALQGYFVVRCIYRRPGCGPLSDDVLSEPSDPFQLAGFFDPDAPARPIRIGLPVDTSPAGLRKFDKNTAFVLSDLLCGHVKRAKGMSFGDLVMSVLPFPFHKDLDGGNAPCRTSSNASLGTICSLSIPIITLCAFLLLIIMVSLLDLIFRWTPYFMICFPVKGLDAKKT